jgi:ABC-type sugar transport system substrate-binding protein
MCNNPPVEESEQYTVAYAGPNNYLEGQVEGEIIHEKLGGQGAKIVMIEGLAGQDAQINRAQGMLDKLEELGSDVELIARQTADWRKDKAVQVMQDFITRYGDEIDGVYAQDDTLAIGAAIAMQEAGIDPSSIPIFGLGGSKEGLKAIDEGLIYSTVLQSPIHETNLVATMAVEMVQKGFTKDDKWDPYWNFMDTPKIYKSNVAEYLPGDW